MTALSQNPTPQSKPSRVGCLDRNAISKPVCVSSRKTVRRVALLMLVGFAGCSPYQLARRTLYGELAEYPRVTDGRIACQQYQRWAKQEWERLLAENPDETYSSDYGSGFIQGFVDQVFAGGSVEPPAVPPHRYWRIGYRSERGRRAIESWYNGFEHGARIAKDNGYRDRAVIPSSLFLDPPEQVAQFEDPLNSSVPLEAPRSEALNAEPLDAEPLEAESIQAEPAVPGPRPADEHLPAEPMPSPEEILDDSPQLAPPPDDLFENDVELPLGLGGPTSMTLDRPAPISPPAREAPSQAKSQFKPVDFQERAAALAAKPADDPPPAPPWHGATSGPKPGRSKVRRASATEPVEFDPFEGTPFATSLRAAAEEPSSDQVAPSTTEEVPTTSPARQEPRHALGVGTRPDSGEPTLLSAPIDSNHVAAAALSGPFPSEATPPVKLLELLPSDSSSHLHVGGETLQPAGGQAFPQEARIAAESTAERPRPAKSRQPDRIGTAGKNNDAASDQTRNDGWQAKPSTPNSEWKSVR